MKNYTDIVTPLALVNKSNFASKFKQKSLMR